MSSDILTIRQGGPPMGYGKVTPAPYDVVLSALEVAITRHSEAVGMQAVSPSEATANLVTETQDEIDRILKRLRKQLCPT